MDRHRIALRLLPSYLRNPARFSNFKNYLNITAIHDISGTAKDRETFHTSKQYQILV